jgi:MerR family transcriptional regulator, thiopeptide resistance regulator
VRPATGCTRAGDLQRLRQILFYRELGFALEQIAEILADPAAGADEHLRRQHRLLRERRTRTELLLNAIEHEMEAQEMGITLTPEEQLEVFGSDKFAEYNEEAEQRWGQSQAFTESQRRTAGYTKDDFVAIKREADENLTAFAAALAAGEPATSAVATDLAEAHRGHMSRWFYECSSAHHRDLAELYVSDPRFTKFYDEVAPRLAQYIHDAILANSERDRR